MATAKNKDNAITMADVAALNPSNPPADETPSNPPADETPAESVDASARVEYEVEGGGEIFLSEGMRHDLLVYGAANDPNTGKRVTRR